MYRDDVKEFGLETEKETFLTEEQFECLEKFCLDQVKKIQTIKDSAFLIYHDTGKVNTKFFILSFRKHLDIM